MVKDSMKIPVGYALATTLATAACMYSTPTVPHPQEATSWTQDRREAVLQHIEQARTNPKLYPQLVDRTIMRAHGGGNGEYRLVHSEEQWIFGSNDSISAGMSITTYPKSNEFLFGSALQLQASDGSMREEPYEAISDFNGQCKYAKSGNDSTKVYSTRRADTTHIGFARTACSAAWGELEKLLTPTNTENKRK